MNEPSPCTSIGGFPIGFRRARSAWQSDLPALLKFASESHFSFLDLGPVSPQEVEAVRSAGMPVGTVDLQDWPALLSLDAGERKAAVMVNASHIRSHVAVGVNRFLSVLVPQDPAAARRGNFDRAVESYTSLARAAAECGAKILLEGAPGRPPYFANLGCTPADLRAFLLAVDSPAIGVNFDPSHLVRMGIDPVQFINEFAPRIGHAHAKDTVFLPTERYEHGTLQEPTFAKPHVFGGFGWRYALPGRGAVDWWGIMTALNFNGYRGGISIELEDEQFLSDERAEKNGLLSACAFLSGRYS